MRKKTLLKHICIVWSLLGLLFVSCGDEWSEGQPTPETNGEEIRLKIELPMEKDVARATEDATSLETTINTISVFFFNTQGELVTKKETTPSAEAGWSQGYINFTENTDNIRANAASVYVVTNYTVTIAESELTEDKLKACVVDNVIAPTANITSFAMEGHTKDVNKDATLFATVSLKRLAVKVRLHLTLGDVKTADALKDVVESWNYDARGLLHRRTTQSYLVEEGGDVLSLPQLETSTDQSFIQFIQSADDADYQNWQYGGEVANPLVGYSYENNWSTESARKTQIILRIPYNKKTDGGGSELVSNNYYQVDLDDVKIERNKIYDVYVTINGLGSDKVDLPATITGHTILINEWITSSIDMEMINDHLYVANNEFVINYERVSFYFMATQRPVLYVSQGEDNILKDGTTATVAPYDQDTKSGLVNVYRPAMDRFPAADDFPFVFYTSLHVNTIVKTVKVSQYPSSYFYKNDNGSLDYTHIVTPVSTADYPIASVTWDEDSRADGLVTTKWDNTNDNVSNNFVVEDADATGVTVSDYQSAFNYCLQKQQNDANGYEWRVPTTKELELIYEAAGKSSGNLTLSSSGYYVSARSTYPYVSGYVLNAGKGEIEARHYISSRNTYHVRCVRNYK